MSTLIDVEVEAPPTLAQPLVVPADQSPTIVEQFGALFAQAEEWRQKAHAIRVTDVSQKDAMKLARESRLALRRIRCDVENRRKELKEEALRTGQTIDGIARVFRTLVEPIEDYLEKQETFAERLAVKQREARRADRARSLELLGFNHADYDLGAMPDEQFRALLDLAVGMKASREEAARKAEEEKIRKAAEAEAERVKREEDLRRAREEAEAARKAQAEAEAARREAEAKAAEAARKAKAEADRIEAARRAEFEAREAEERRKREAAEAEARRLREAEEARKRDEERRREEEAARIEAAAKAGDKEKLTAFAQLIRDSVLSSVPSVKSKAASAKVAIAIKNLTAAIAALET